jgi:GTP pyrophosphokinase
LTRRFGEAFEFAREKHAGQKRKGTEIPYLAHLLAVAALVLEDGGNEDEAIAALLHDVIEDQGVRPQEIEERFGARVARIVQGCSDTDQMPKPPWRQRKERYLAHLDQAPPDVLRVSAADKLHNLRCIVADYRSLGEQVWKRFKGGREGTLWYYRSLARAFRQLCPGFLSDELERNLAELERLAGAGHDVSGPGQGPVP